MASVGTLRPIGLRRRLPWALGPSKHTNASPPMTPADFEESEFRGPLYNQLERGNHLIWEPGQVFEKHIGIDRAAYVTDPMFWGLHSHTYPMSGVVLMDYDWSYIWKQRLKNKLLPDFKLNLFLQAKRPHAGTRPRGKIRSSGIVGDYWKFDITPHQQVALERMSGALSGSALVCYAAPAFHTQAALYEHTKSQSIVSASTFPSADTLAGHGAWYYNRGGLFGVANPDFVRVDVEPLQQRIENLVRQHQEQRTDAAASLAYLAESLVQSSLDVAEPSSTDTWFQLQIQRADEIIDAMRALGQRDEASLSSTRHFAQVRAFCNAYRLDWYVLGSGA
jgi:hypothetical protein